jgi:hypothetical protein
MVRNEPKETGRDLQERKSPGGTGSRFHVKRYPFQVRESRVPVRIVQTALSLVPGGVHFSNSAAKSAYPAMTYLTVQRLYFRWQFFGIAIFGALLLNGTAAAMLAGQAGFSWALAACLLLIVSLGIFFIWTYPVKQATASLALAKR